MKAAVSVCWCFVARQRTLVAALLSLNLALAPASSARAEEGLAPIELEMACLASPWGAPSYHLEEPCLIKIRNTGPDPLTIPVTGRAIVPVDLREIVVQPGMTREYVVMRRRISEFGPAVLLIYSGDDTL